MRTALFKIPDGRQVRVPAHYRTSAFGDPGYYVWFVLDGKEYEGYSSYSEKFHGEPWAIEDCIADAVRCAMDDPWLKVRVETDKDRSHGGPTLDIQQ